MEKRPIPMLLNKQNLDIRGNSHVSAWPREELVNKGVQLEILDTFNY